MRPKLPSLKRISLMHSLRALLGRGEQNAITAKNLASMIGTNERAIRLAVHDLRAEGLPVAATVSPPYGFFLIDTRKEYDMVVANMEARIRESARTLVNIKRGYQRNQEVNYQPRLRLEVG